MGHIEKNQDTWVYRQDNGEITATLTSIEEKMVLSHEGSRGYRRLFILLVLVGLAYLAYIFLSF